MKKLSYLMALFCIVGAALFAGCQKQETPAVPTTPSMPATNAPVP